MAAPLTPPQLDALRLALPRLFGNLDEATFLSIHSRLPWEWVERAAGEVLFVEGDPSDALFLLLSGRLQATVSASGGVPQIVGEIGRGESVGEMGVLTNKPRRATVMALRDSILARVELSAFNEMLQSFPSLALNFTRVIIERLERRNASQKPTHNVTNLAV
ncbi:MAG: cyclic nucleotide-binding domain-containing protein, partial [Verrucomicrobiota bacterium]|nr:cyclic nucleotide-binding domain-containing protein [Verrucomicrobiota bacterium]